MTEQAENTPIYFKSLSVENVLCFSRRQTLDLTDKDGNPAQWTVILGDNGTGKTTLLRSLAAMEITQFSGGGKKRVLGPRIYSMHVQRTWRAMDLPFMWPSIQENTDDNFFEAEIVSGQKLQHSDKQGQRPETIRFSASYQGLVDFIPDDKRSLDKDFICYGYGANRKLGRTQIAESLRILGRELTATLFDEQATLMNAEEWLVRTDYAALKSQQDERPEHSQKKRREFSQIKDILKNILPDVDDVEVSTDSEGTPQARFKTPYGWVPLHGLGLGYKTVIAWMVDLASRLFARYPDSEDPLSEPAIVLVDEIDLHLHPRWQRTIMSFLTERFPNTQFIVTAHSPLVVQAAADANLVLLRREGDHVVIDNDPEVIDNWRIDQVLTSVFGLPSARPPKLDELLERREALLSKAELTDADERKLDEIEAKIGRMPTAERPEDIEAMDIIRRAAEILGDA